MDALISSDLLKPSPDRLIGLRKQLLLAPSALVSTPASHSARFPDVSRSTALLSQLSSLQHALTFATTAFIATELVAVLAISCAWLVHPHAELRLRAGLPPPTWLPNWIAAFRALHCGCVNLALWCWGEEGTSEQIAVLVALGMYGVAVFCGVLTVAAFVGRAVVMAAWEEHVRWPWGAARGREGRRGAVGEGKPILKGEDVLPLDERRMLKRE